MDYKILIGIKTFSSENFCIETTGPKISSWQSCISGVTPVRMVGLENRKSENGYLVVFLSFPMPLIWHCPVYSWDGHWSGNSKAHWKFFVVFVFAKCLRWMMVWGICLTGSGGLPLSWLLLQQPLSPPFALPPPPLNTPCCGRTIRFYDAWLGGWCDHLCWDLLMRGPWVTPASIPLPSICWDSTAA